MRNRILLTGVVFTLFAGSPFTARAQGDREGWGLGNATATTVTGASGTVTALNYSENGVTVDGLLVDTGTGTTALLVFRKPVCGGIGSLVSKLGDTVKYSGVALDVATNFQLVNVTSYSDGTINYPSPAPLKPTAVTLTGGAITQLNYSENGSVDGFLLSGFTVTAPTTGLTVSSPVFVNVGTPSSKLAGVLTKGATVSVTGMLEPPPQCSTSGTPSEVDPTSLTDGTTTYPIGKSMGFFWGVR